MIRRIACCLSFEGPQAPDLARLSAEPTVRAQLASLGQLLAQRLATDRESAAVRECVSQAGSSSRASVDDDQGWQEVEVPPPVPRSRPPSSRSFVAWLDAAAPAEVPARVLDRAPEVRDSATAPLGGAARLRAAYAVGRSDWDAAQRIARGQRGARQRASEPWQRDLPKEVYTVVYGVPQAPFITYSAEIYFSIVRPDGAFRPGTVSRALSSDAELAAYSEGVGLLGSWRCL